MAGGLNFGPQSQQTVVMPREPPQGLRNGPGFSQALDGAIELEQLPALEIIANQTLDPKHAAKARSASHRTYAMPRCRGVDDHVAGGQFDRLAAEGIIDDEFAAFIRFRRHQK